jgi:hypothetical protein
MGNKLNIPVYNMYNYNIYDNNNFIYHWEFFNHEYNKYVFVRYILPNGSIFGSRYGISFNKYIKNES